MNKIIYIDIGTHFAQEYQSIFGSSKYFFSKIIYQWIRRFIGYYVLGRGEKFSLIELWELIRERYDLNSRKNVFYCYFVEANSRVISNCDAYKAADGVFNCALTGGIAVSLVNLYIANNDELGQGSSILLTKHNVSKEHSVPTVGIPANLFFRSLKKLIERDNSKYSVVLRLNCEGVEDDVIYAAHNVFSKKLLLILGSLKDVSECKGEEAYYDLEDYLQKNELPFIFFSGAVTSWLLAHKGLNNVIKGLKIRDP